MLPCSEQHSTTLVPMLKSNFKTNHMQTLLSFSTNDISKSYSYMHLSHSTVDVLTECAGQAGLEHLSQNLRVFLSKSRGHR
jgi:hypothetical protein